MAGALSDIRVLDVSTEVAGPYCARLLGDFGADVIKVEPLGGDPGRRLDPLVDGVDEPDRSAFFAFLNANKRGICLNLDTLQGQAMFRALARQADIVVESFPPGYLDERRVGYDLLDAARPGIILTSITPFGQTGPWRDREGADITAFALSGWADINARAGGPPLKGSGHQASFVAAVAAFLGTLAALIHRDRTGEGDHVDVSTLEALTEIFGPRFLAAQHGATADRPMSPGVTDFMAGPVPCRDGYFSLTLSRAHFWRDAMNELGLSELATDEHFWSRQANRADLARKVEPAIAQRGKYELFERLSTLRVVSGMVLTTKELYENPHVRDRGFFVEVEQPGIGRVEMPGAPFKMGATPASYRRPAPRLGEHTDEVLAEMLALTADDIEGLRHAGDIA
ncbi:MAG TPA: CoA transferase [Dehalococcoidia bacterium]|nr:CoA transferase [Dehalococcoidia bacterium]